MGAVVVDAGVVIGLLDADDAHHDAVLAELRKVRDSGDALLLPASAFSEVLVEPARRSSAAVAETASGLHRVPMNIVPVDEGIAMEASFLRAEHRSLRLPDALVIATARVHSAAVLVTTDRRWPSRKALKLAAELVVL